MAGQDPEGSLDEILEAYRRRRAAQRPDAVGEADGVAAGAPGPQAPPGAARDPTASAAAPDGLDSRSGAAGTPERHAPPGTATPPPGPDPRAPPPSGRALPALAREGPEAASPLSARRLDEFLRTDHNVTVRGLAAGRAAGYILLFAALGTALLFAVASALTQQVLLVAGIPLPLLALAAAVPAVLVVVLFSFLPRRRRMVVRVAGTQGHEWQRVQRLVRRLDLMWGTGVALAGAGLAGAVGALALLPGPPVNLAAAALFVAACGFAVLASALAQRPLARRLYVQTLVLARLELEGMQVSGDSRLARVLEALDRLLGQLPESSVRSFLATRESREYLALLDEVRGTDAPPEEA